MKVKHITMAIGTALFAILSLNAFVSPMRTSFNGGEDDYGHVLMDLWAKYRKANQKDLPEDAVKAAKEIVEEATERRLPWDFYEGWEAYRNSSVRRNWKTRSAVDSSYAEAVASFDEPVVTFSYMRRYKGCGSNELWQWASGEKSRLQAASNRQFHEHGAIAGMMGGCLPKYVSNDWEYVLWVLLQDRGNRIVGYAGEAVYEELVALSGGQYPKAAYLEYLSAARLSGEEARRSALEEVAERHSGKAVGCYAGADLLSMKFDSLSRSEATAKDYEALHAGCKAFERVRKSLSGSEAAMVKDTKEVEDLIKTLTGQGLSVRVEDGQAAVLFRNLTSATLTMTKEGKTLLHKEVRNPSGSFYVLDTVNVALPVLDDGEYELNVKNGKVEGDAEYSRHTLSVATRRTSAHDGIYVADSQTGEPLHCVDLTLKKSGKVVAKEVGFTLGDGFTDLPSSFEAVMAGKNSYYQLSVSAMEDGRLRISDDLVLRRTRDMASASSEVPGFHAILMTDRGAYNPCDTVFFKGVLYKGDLKDENHVCRSGQKAEVSLKDSEGNVVGTVQLTTNEFGSVSGEFGVPSDVRGGWFRLCLSGGEYKCERSIRVDEFVLPTFDLSFDDDDRLWQPGDTVEVRGRLESYSGHPLSGARLSYVAKSGNRVLSEGTLHPSQDGSFTVRFPTDSTRSWNQSCLTVNVMDETGETQEFSKWITVSNRISVSAEVQGVDAEGKGIKAGDDDEEWLRDEEWQDAGIAFVSGDVVSVGFKTTDATGSLVSVPISYSIKDEAGTVLYEGVAKSGETKALDLSGKHGKFVIDVSAVKGAAKGRSSVELYKVSDDAATLDAPLSYYFRCMGTELREDEDIKMRLGSASGPLWAVMEVYGESGQVLGRRLIHLDGVRGEENSIADIVLDYEDSWPDAVYVRLFWFKDWGCKSVSREFRRVRHSLELPLSFASIEDRTLPGRRCHVSMETAADVEAAVSIFDKATDRIASNNWPVVSAIQEHATLPRMRQVLGSIDSWGASPDVHMAKGEMMVSMRISPRAAAMEEAEYEVAEDMAAEEAGSGADNGGDVQVRDRFAKTLLWKPDLRSSADGGLSFDFETSGSLSTFIVQVHAHDKEMRNAVVRKEFVVTLPVKVAVAEPQYLYVGDRPALAVSVSSTASEPVQGTLTLEQYDGGSYEGATPVRSLSVPMTVDAGASSAHSFDLGEMADSGVVGLKVTFAADGFSDAMFVTVPVYAAMQVLAEAHSAVVLAGDDEAAIVERLRGSFVNTSSDGATCKTLTLIDMVREALPSKVEPSDDDVLSLSEAFYVRLLSESLGSAADYILDTKDLYDKIAACRNADGGFSWYEGGHSSPVITAVMLERMAKLSESGLLPSYCSGLDLNSAVKYLDDSYFAVDLPFWCGGVSMAQYLYVRSLYPAVEFSPSRGSGSASEKAFSKRMKEFRKDAKEYLTPSKSRGLDGEVFSKARRLNTLWHLTASSDGVALAKSWGIGTLGLGAAGKMDSSLEADVASLLQYAVEHKDGGIYYPNLVMPFRGLLESEAYAHSMLCDLMTAYAGGKSESSSDEALAVADGIRLWLMLQKETQKWGEDPAFVDAIASVMDGSDEVKATRVVALSKTYEKPFAEIEASGNGFAVSRKFMRERSVPDVENPGGTKKVTEEIHSGDEIRRGDKITAVYEIWNGENRSFVRLTAPREAALRPVEQLSGWCRNWRPTPLRVGGWYSFTPYGYRNVKSCETVFSFDAYPEEKSSVSEEFFVTQDGVFTAPVVSIESLYAPHYRANAGASVPLNILPEGR